MAYARSEDPRISPCCGHLITLVTAAAETEALVERAIRLPSLQLSARNICDLELLANGAFSPLDRLMQKKVCERTLSGLLNG